MKNVHINRHLQLLINLLVVLQ